MQDESYEFDPSSIDGSDKEVTLDTWKPRPKKKSIVKSEWRQKEINGNYNQKPGLDEIRKIKDYIKKKYPDHEIMDAFGITSETLVAIKRNCYDPIDGISLDNQSKIYREFTEINDKINTLFDTLNIFLDGSLALLNGAKKSVFKNASYKNDVKKKVKQQ